MTPTRQNRTMAQEWIWTRVIRMAELEIDFLFLRQSSGDA